MAAKIESAFGTQVELLPEGRGIFDVSVDGKLAYSKHSTGVFPNEDELIAAMLEEHAVG